SLLRYRTNFSHSGSSLLCYRYAGSNNNAIAILNQPIFPEMVFHLTHTLIRPKNFIYLIWLHSPNQPQLLANLFALGKGNNGYPGPELSNPASRIPRMGNSTNYLCIYIVGQCYAGISQRFNNLLFLPFGLTVT